MFLSTKLSFYEKFYKKKYKINREIEFIKSQYDDNIIYFIKNAKLVIIDTTKYSYESSFNKKKTTWCGFLKYLKNEKNPNLFVICTCSYENKNNKYYYEYYCKFKNQKLLEIIL